MLKGKVAVATGSTSGIGLGIARALAKQGADIVLNGFGDATVIEELREEISIQHRVKCLHDGADMLDPGACAGLIANAEKTLGSADILVNCAGIQHVAPIDEFPVDAWYKVLSTNLSSSFHTMRAALPGMKKRGWGRIINIVSTHGLVASTGKAAYVAAKHGLLGLTKVVALETAQTGVTCNAICPGWVLTPLVQKQIDALAQRENLDQEEARRRLLAEKQPSGQFATPDQIGGVAVFLCSPAADQMRGAAVTVDGGWTAQ